MWKRWTDVIIIYFGWKGEEEMWRRVRNKSWYALTHLLLDPVFPWVVFLPDTLGSIAREEHVRRRILTEMFQELKRCPREQDD